MIDIFYYIQSVISMDGSQRKAVNDRCDRLCDGAGVWQKREIRLGKGTEKW